MQLCLAAPLVLLACIAPGPAGSGVPERASVQVLTDRLEVAVGVPVRIGDGAGTVVALTDLDGQTPWVPRDLSAAVEVVLGETRTPGGTLLGTMETVASPLVADPLDDERLLMVSRTQPLAVPVHVVGLPGQVNDVLPPDGDAPLWRVVVPQLSRLDFHAEVAALLDGAAIEQYLAYQGHAPGIAYTRGVVLVVPGVQLEAGGLLVGIDLLGDLPGGVTVDVFNIASQPTVVPLGPPLAASVVTVHDGVVYLHLQGGVARGHLALLARSSSGPAPEVLRLTSRPPAVVVPDDGGPSPGGGDGEEPGADARLAAVTPPVDCEPPVPQQPSGWTCTAAQLDNDCGAAVPQGSLDCRVRRSRTGRTCLGPGGKLRVQRGRTRAWKVTYHLRGGEGTPLSSQGGFEYGIESVTVVTNQWTAMSGAHGLGQCMRFFRFDLICAGHFKTLIDGVSQVEGGHPYFVKCARSKVQRAGCSDTSVSQATCDRQP